MISSASHFSRIRSGIKKQIGKRQRTRQFHHPSILCLPRDDRPTISFPSPAAVLVLSPEFENCLINFVVLRCLCRKPEGVETTKELLIKMDGQYQSLADTSLSFLDYLSYHMGGLADVPSLCRGITAVFLEWPASE